MPTIVAELEEVETIDTSKQSQQKKKKKGGHWTSSLAKY